MASKRLARLAEQLKRELSELIRTQVRDPRVGIVTITGVDVAADLGSAQIYVRSVDDGMASTLEGLEAAAPFLRTRLGQLLHVRRVPELRFREDRSYEGARRIEEVLAQVLPDEEPDDGADEGAGDDAERTPAGDETPAPPDPDDGDARE